MCTSFGIGAEIRQGSTVLVTLMVLVQLQAAQTPATRAKPPGAVQLVMLVAIEDEPVADPDVRIEKTYNYELAAEGITS